MKHVDAITTVATYSVLQSVLQISTYLFSVFINSGYRGGYLLRRLISRVEQTRIYEVIRFA